MNECLECGRELRPPTVSAEDKPGTRPVHGRGLCRPCWTALDSSGTLDSLYPVERNDYGQIVRRLLVARDRTSPCADCGRDMRPPGTKAEDWPGTVSRKGPRCATCAAQRLQTRGPVVPTPADVLKMREDLKDWFHSRGRDWRLSGIPA
jgi:hypothetical protein